MWYTLHTTTQGTINLITAAASAGSVRRIVLETSALTGADEAGGVLGKLAFAALNYGTEVLYRKKEAEAALKQVAAESGGKLTYTIVR